MLSLKRKLDIDLFIGSLLLIALRPLTTLLGLFLRRDHSLDIKGSLYFCKILGGGSLVVALPSLLGLRHRYPDVRFVLVTSKAVEPFARLLGIFDEIITINDSSLVGLITSGFSALRRSFRADTFVDFEVYSKLSTIFGLFTCARNRIGFYLEGVSLWRKVCTHLVFFNRFSGQYLFYEQVARLLGAAPASPEACRTHLRQILGSIESSDDALAIGAGCSDFGKERILGPYEWLKYAQRHFNKQSSREVHLLGAKSDYELSEKIASLLRFHFPKLKVTNHCGELSLANSIWLLGQCREFWGIDSSLLHFSRLLGLRSVSFWGPTDPQTRLAPIAGLEEEIHYKKILCSPCIHIAGAPPCHGNNLCMQGLFSEVPILGWQQAANTVVFSDPKSIRPPRAAGDEAPEAQILQPVASDKLSLP